MRDYQALIETCDAQIKAGHAHSVLGTLARIEATRVPRQWKMPLAKICRRAGLYSLGLSLLNRLIHPAAGHSSTASAQEIAEYAMLLLRSGAVREAQECLKSVDPLLVPESSLYRAYAHFTRWEFAESIPHLQTYLQAPLDLYAKLVGQTNLAYAYVESRQHGPAVNLLNELIETTAREGHSLLESNCRAYLAQALLQHNDFARARQEIASVQHTLERAHSNDQLIVRKWKLILDATEKRDVAPLAELKRVAEASRDWATLREADFFKLKIAFDRGLFWHIYFGTPYASLRRQLENEFKITPDRDTYVWGKKSAPRFDLRTGQIDGKKAIKPGMMTHKLMEVLLRDFYQPLRIGELFSELFANEFFSPITSPDRVHQLISRTRRWLLSARIPVVIEELDGFYKLQVNGNFSFRVPLERATLDPMTLQFAAIAEHMRGRASFTAMQIRQELKLPKTTVFRILTWALENSKIERLGLSPNTFAYRITQPEQLKRAA